ncbi:MAG: NAD(P)H-hydrate dehydratase [Oscillospiraceae bacterium]|jgi:NAD(P)H-hydrate epimerase|nr:NAD(P)H-hydrate dehydratase [Oscillospiraceae bacterium]
MQNASELESFPSFCTLPLRNPAGHKGSFGHVLSVCGCERYPGAAVLAACGAVHCGAGLVTAAFPRAAYAAIAPQLAAAPLLPLPGNRQGTLHLSALPALRAALTGKTAVLLGCGLGLNADTKAITAALLQETTLPLVLDADGINAIAAHRNEEGKPSFNLSQANARAVRVLTPHPGEMARLLGCSVAEVEARREPIAREFAEKHHVVLVLKGAKTVVAAPGRDPHTCTMPPNTGLAKGGSGDLLAGMTASLLAQGMPPFEAACAAVELHARTAARAARRFSARGITATDCVDELKELLSYFECVFLVPFFTI